MNLYLYWSYSGQSQTIIPSSNMKYLQYLNSIPLTLQVYPSCGNGVLTVNEEWDDGNNVDYDGCSSNWKTETLSKSKLDILFWIFLAILIAGAIANLLSKFIANYSVSSVFGFINEVQLILLLPMLPHFMPQFIEDFIAKLNYCLFSFSFLYDFISLKMFNIQFSLSYNQPTYYIDLMNIKSGSTLINIQGNLMTLLQIASLHLTILILHYFIRHKQNLPWYLRWIRRLKEFMTFGVYIQYTTLSCLLVCLISSTEIQRFDHSKTTNKFKLYSQLA